MILRLLAAGLGAIAVTSVLLLGMDAVTDVFRERSDQRMYRISDVIRRDRSGRPEMPETPAPLPALPDSAADQATDPQVSGGAPNAPEPPLSRPSVTIETSLDPEEPESTEN